MSKKKQTILNRFLTGFKQKTLSLANSNVFNGFENSLDSGNLQTYKDSLYLYIGVSMISKRVAGIELDLFEVTNSKGEIEEVNNHEILDLMNRPNKLQTRREFWELSVTYYLLAGESFWYLDRGENGKKINRIYTLRPDHMEIKLSTDGRDIIAYEYGEFANRIIIRPEDILHFKNIDPTNQLRGVGVVRPASSRIATEKEASKYQANFFKNQGRPDVAIFLDREITSEQSAEARESWKKIYGHGNGGQAGFFGADVKELKELNVTPKEMDFIASQNFLRDDILASLHIPKAMVTSDDVNLANAKEANIMYLTEAVIPVLETFLDIINNKFLDTVDNNQLFFNYESPVPKDREMLLKELTQLTGKVYTQNEARELVGLPAMEGADSLQDVSLVQAGRTQEAEKQARRILKRRPLLAKTLRATEAVAQVLLDSKVNDTPRNMNSIFPTHESKQAYAKAFNDKVDTKAKTFGDILDDFHKGLEERILKFGKDGFDPETFMQVEQEKGNALRDFKPFMQKFYSDEAQKVLDSLFDKTQKEAIPQAEEFLITEDMKSTIDIRAEFFINSMLDTTYKDLQKTIIAGLSEGNSTQIIGQSIRSKFADISVARGKTIARTETSWLLSSSSNDAFQQSNVVTGKEWISVGDMNVRDSHKENNGEIVSKGGVFPSGEAFPGQNTINCRCVLAPAV